MIQLKSQILLGRIYHAKLLRVSAWDLRDAVHADRQSVFHMRGASVELINGWGGTRVTEIRFIG